MFFCVNLHNVAAVRSFASLAFGAMKTGRNQDSVILSVTAEYVCLYVGIVLEFHVSFNTPSNCLRPSAVIKIYIPYTLLVMWCVVSIAPRQCYATAAVEIDTKTDHSTGISGGTATVCVVHSVSEVLHPRDPTSDVADCIKLYNA